MATIKAIRQQEVIIEYKVLPEVYGSPDDDFIYLPEQIEIEEVWIEIPSKTGKTRRINITDSVSDTEILDFEDAVIEHRAAIKKQFLSGAIHAKPVG